MGNFLSSKYTAATVAGLGIASLAGFHFSARDKSPAEVPSLEKSEARSAPERPQQYLLQQRVIRDFRPALTEEFRSGDGSVWTVVRVYECVDPHSKSDKITFTHTPLGAVYPSPTAKGGEHQLMQMSSTPVLIQHLRNRLSSIRGISVDDIEVLPPTLDLLTVLSTNTQTMHTSLTAPDLQRQGASTTVALPLWVKNEVAGLNESSPSIDFRMELWDGSVAEIDVAQKLDLVASAVSEIKGYSDAVKAGPEAVRSFVAGNRDTIETKISSKIKLAFNARRILPEHEQIFQNYQSNPGVTVLNAFLQNGRLDSALVSYLMGDKGAVGDLLSGAQPAGTVSDTKGSMNTTAESKSDTTTSSKEHVKESSKEAHINAKTKFECSYFGLIGGSAELEVGGAARWGTVDKSTDIDQATLESRGENTISDQIATTENQLRDLRGTSSSSIAMEINLEAGLTFRQASIAPSFVEGSTPVYVFENEESAHKAIAEQVKTCSAPYAELLRTLEKLAARLHASHLTLNRIHLAQAELSSSCGVPTTPGVQPTYALPKSLEWINPLDGFTEREAVELLKVLPNRWRHYAQQMPGEKERWVAEGLREHLETTLSALLTEIESSHAALTKLYNEQSISDESIRNPLVLYTGKRISYLNGCVNALRRELSPN